MVLMLLFSKGIVDHFNKCFVNVGGVTHWPQNFLQILLKLIHLLVKNFSLFPKMMLKVWSTIKILKNGKAAGLDGISTRILKAI